VASWEDIAEILQTEWRFIVKSNKSFYSTLFMSGYG